MNKQDLQKLNNILAQPRFTHTRLLEQWRDTAEVTEEAPKGTRTSAQNRAMHMWLSQVATALNDAGLPMQKVLTVDLDWDGETAKEYLWRPVQKSLLKKDSTTQLTKEEVTRVYETLNRLLGEKWGIHVPFPNDVDRSLENAAGYLGGYDIRNSDNYPEA